MSSQRRSGAGRRPVPKMRPRSRPTLSATASSGLLASGSSGGVAAPMGVAVPSAPPAARSTWTIGATGSTSSSIAGIGLRRF
eukprot:9469752-Pyramimonas_sp.AAC.1